MADFNSSYLLKLFVKVPTGTTFDGASTTTSSKVYFDENTYTIWAKGKQYGISPEYKEKVDNILTYVGASEMTLADVQQNGSLYARIAAAVLATDQLRSYTYSYMNTLYSDKNTTDSIQNIAYGAAQAVLDAALTAYEDSTYVIDKLNEVITWFNHVSEESSGAQLITDVTTLKTNLGTAEPVTASATGSAFERIAYVMEQVSNKNVGAHGETGANALVYSYADANNVFTYSSSKLTTAVGLAETSVQAVIGESENPLISVSHDNNKSYTVSSTEKLQTAVGLAESAAQSITSNGTGLITVGYTGTAYTINYTDALSTAVAYANSAIQTVNGETGNDALIEASTENHAVTLSASNKLTDAIAKAEASAQSITTANNDLITIASYNNGAYTIGYTTTLNTAVAYAYSAIQTLSIAGHDLDKTANSISTEDLKTDILGDITGYTTYTDAASGIIVTISYSAGVITGVTLSGAALNTRVDNIEIFIQDYDPWMVHVVQS